MEGNVFMLQNFSYNGTNIQRCDDGFINLTQMCNANGKRLDNWMRLKQTEEYITELQCSLTSEESVIRTEKGIYADGRDQGTWGHPSLAINLARWISASFAVWCDNHIFRLMETGTTSIAVQPQPTTLKDDYLLVSAMITDAFATVPLKPELLGGLKINAAIAVAPHLAHALEESRQLLITNTAQEWELLTVTAIGKRLDGLSARKVNQMLIDKGFQVKNPNKKSSKDSSYLPTPLGSEFSDLTLATGSNGSGTFQQLRWYSSIVDQLV